MTETIHLYKTTNGYPIRLLLDSDGVVFVNRYDFVKSIESRALKSDINRIYSMPLRTSENVRFMIYHGESVKSLAFDKNKDCFINVDNIVSILSGKEECWYIIDVLCKLKEWNIDLKNRFRIAMSTIDDFCCMSMINNDLEVCPTILGCEMVDYTTVAGKGADTSDKGGETKAASGIPIGHIKKYFNMSINGNSLSGFVSTDNVSYFNTGELSVIANTNNRVFLGDELREFVFYQGSSLVISERGLSRFLSLIDKCDAKHIENILVTKFLPFFKDIDVNPVLNGSGYTLDRKDFFNDGSVRVVRDSEGGFFVCATDISKAGKMSFPRLEVNRFCNDYKLFAILKSERVETHPFVTVDEARLLINGIQNEYAEAVIKAMSDCAKKSGSVQESNNPKKD